MSITSILADVQKELKAPKNQYNSFGKYKYRSCEDILEAAKPLCIAHGAVLTLGDTIEMVGERVYVKATAMLMSIEDNSIIEVSAYAREAEEKKGMDDAQITGSASSYARKYALSGLFCLDDTKDPDATNDGTDNTTKAKNNTKAKNMVDKAKDAGIGEPEYKCCDCGAPFNATVANGKSYTAEQIFRIAINGNTDNKPRCGQCAVKAGTKK